MRQKTGNQIIEFALPALDGSQWSSTALEGKPYLLTFFRFAACPFCNMRLHYLIKSLHELPDDFTIVAVFDSPLDNLQRYAEKHQSPVPILADEGGVLHARYGVELSWLGVLKGMFLRLPVLIKAVFMKGYIPLSVKGKLNTMPASFLVDRQGVIQEVYYGRDEGDHIPFERVKAFASAQSDIH